MGEVIKFQKVRVVSCRDKGVWVVLTRASKVQGWKPGGGGYSQKNWVGVCGPLPKTLTLPYLWPDQKSETQFMTRPSHENPVSDLHFKRSCQNISRIENQWQKIEIFFILPKHPFLWTSFEKNILKFQRFFFRLNFKKVCKFVRKAVFALPKRSNRHATLRSCWQRLESPLTIKLCTMIIILLHNISIKKSFIVLFGMIFIAVFIEVYFARFFGRQNEG